jgi:hypothetical protein
MSPGMISRITHMGMVNQSDKSEYIFNEKQKIPSDENKICISREKFSKNS